MTGIEISKLPILKMPPVIRPVQQKVKRKEAQILKSNAL